jgi:hypothetical protein
MGKRRKGNRCGKRKRGRNQERRRKKPTRNKIRR